MMALFVYRIKSYNRIKREIGTPISGIETFRKHRRPTQSKCRERRENVFIS